MTKPINMQQFVENVLANIAATAVTDQEKSDIIRATLIGVCELNTKVDELLKALNCSSSDASDNSNNPPVYVLSYSDSESHYIDTVYKNRDDALARLRQLYCELAEKYEEDDNYNLYIITDGTLVGVTFQGAPYAEYVLEEQEVL